MEKVQTAGNLGSMGGFLKYNKVNKHKIMAGEPIKRRKYKGYDNVTKKSIYETVDKIEKAPVNAFYFAVPRDYQALNRVLCST